MATFWFVRHGETEFNRLGLRCGGDVDVPLTASGEEQIRALAPQVHALGIGVIVAGALERTQRSAHILADLLGDVPVLTDARFNERSLGEWNGRPYHEAQAHIRASATPPGGEAEADFRARILDGVAGLCQKMDCNLLLVSSKGVARILNATIGGGAEHHAANGELIAYSLTGVPR
jgi:probable phosphoglycerate mutase